MNALAQDRTDAPRPGVLAVNIRNKSTLYASYMPMLKGGGLFIATDLPFKLGDEVLVLLTLPDEANRIPLTGHVAWVTPANAHGNKPQGIGIQFDEHEAIKPVRARIENLLAGVLQSSKPTHTL